MAEPTRAQTPENDAHWSIATSWARKHAAEHPGHRAKEGLYDPGSCDDCSELSPIYDLAACRVSPPGATR